MLGRFENDIAAASAVAAVGPAELDERLAAERSRAVAALAGTDEDLDLIYERLRFHQSSSGMAGASASKSLNDALYPAVALASSHCAAGNA